MKKTNPDLVKCAMLKGYKIDDDNKVIGPRNKPIKIMIYRGYPCITFKYKDNPRRLDIHRLKAYLLFGDEMFKDGIEVRHLNGNKLDYSSKNIFLGTKRFIYCSLLIFTP